MPNIQQYSAAIGQTPEPTDMAASTAREAGFMENRLLRQGGEAVGGAISRVGGQIGQSIDDHVDGQMISQLASSGAQLTENLSGNINDTMMQANPSDWSVGDGLRANADKSATALMDSAQNGSDRVQNYARQLADHVRQTAYQSISAHEMTRADQAFGQAVLTTRQAHMAVAQDDPSQIPSLIQQDRMFFDNYIQTHAGTGLNADHVAKLRNDMEQSFGAYPAAALQNMIYKNPQGAQAWMNDPTNAKLVQSIPPNKMVQLNGELRVQMRPIEVKNAADSIMGQNVVEADQSSPDAQRLSAPDEATALAMVNQADQRGQKMSVSVGEATPQNPRDANVMLGNWINQAQKKYANDPVMRDQVIQQIKGNVANIVKEQTGIQKQAQGALITKLIGGADGTQAKPTTLTELLADPVSRAAFAKLDPSMARGIDGMLEHNAKSANGEFVKSDPQLYDSLRQRIQLPYGDPNKITGVQDILKYSAPQENGKPGINHTDAERLRQEILQSNSPEGTTFVKQKNEAIDTAKKMLDGSAQLSAHPEFAYEAAHRYGFWLDKQIAAKVAAHQDPSSLFDPGSPDYALNPNKVMTMLPSESDMKAQAASRVKTPGGAATPGQGATAQAPKAALDYLTAHPETKAQFKQKFGYLP